MLRRRNEMLRTVLTGEPPAEESEGEESHDMSRGEGDDLSRGESDDLSRDSDLLSVVNIESLIADQFHGLNLIDD